jgi:phosphotransferase system  glucose/maltose/N-acetylglucosamine-specific IIC component
MRQQRWFPVAALAIGLFAINAVTRLVIRIGFPDNDAAQGRASIVMFALIGLVIAVWTYVDAQRRPPSQWLGPLAAGAFLGLLLTVLVGPLISGDQPFAAGAGNFFAQVWLYSAFAIVGTLLGYWTAVMLGRDYRSRSLKAYSEARKTKPRRVVRR